jgi:hypothetical protein
MTVSTIECLVYVDDGILIDRGSKIEGAIADYLGMNIVLGENEDTM